MASCYVVGLWSSGILVRPCCAVQGLAGNAARKGGDRVRDLIQAVSGRFACLALAATMVLETVTGKVHKKNLSMHPRSPVDTEGFKKVLQLKGCWTMSVCMVITRNAICAVWKQRQACLQRATA